MTLWGTVRDEKGGPWMQTDGIFSKTIRVYPCASVATDVLRLFPGAPRLYFAG